MQTTVTDTYVHTNKYANLSWPLPNPMGYISRLRYSNHEGRQVQSSKTGNGSLLIASDIT